MSAKQIIIVGLKVMALTIILSVSFMVGAMVSGISAPLTDVPAPPASAESSPSDAGATLPVLLLSSLLETIVLTYIILRSRWRGWKLAAAVFLAMYGLMTVVAQTESIVYLQDQLPPGMVPGLFAMGAIAAGLFSPLAVLVLGRARRELAPQAPNPRLVMPPGQWAWKLVAIAVAYLVLLLHFWILRRMEEPGGASILRRHRSRQLLRSDSIDLVSHAMDVSFPSLPGTAVGGVRSASDSDVQGPIVGGELGDRTAVFCVKQPTPDAKSVHARGRSKDSSRGNRLVKFPLRLGGGLAAEPPSLVVTQSFFRPEGLRVL